MKNMIALRLTAIPPDLQQVPGTPKRARPHESARIRINSLGAVEVVSLGLRVSARETFQRMNLDDGIPIFQVSMLSTSSVGGPAD